MDIFASHFPQPCSHNVSLGVAGTRFGPQDFKSGAHDILADVAIGANQFQHTDTEHGLISQAQLVLRDGFVLIEFVSCQNVQVFVLVGGIVDNPVVNF